MSTVTLNLRDNGGTIKATHVVDESAFFGEWVCFKETAEAQGGKADFSGSKLCPVCGKVHGVSGRWP